MIWATVSSWSCLCWLYRASPSLAAKNIMNLISVLTILRELFFLLFHSFWCYAGGCNISPPECNSWGFKLGKHPLTGVGVGVGTPMWSRIWGSGDSRTGAAVLSFLPPCPLTPWGSSFSASSRTPGFLAWLREEFLELPPCPRPKGCGAGAGVWGRGPQPPPRRNYKTKIRSLPNVTVGESGLGQAKDPAWRDPERGKEEVSRAPAASVEETRVARLGDPSPTSCSVTHWSCCGCSLGPEEDRKHPTFSAPPVLL